MTYQREFAYSRDNYDFLRKFAAEKAGISLSDTKFEMLYSRLVRRLRALNLKNFDQYCALLSTNNTEEIRAFINAITIHVSYFFREPHHFEYLAHEYLPTLLNNKSRPRRLRILSAGCATGVEPYSIAMVLKEVIPLISQWDIKVLGVDINTDVLAQAKSGIYSEEEQKNVSKERLNKWFYRDDSTPTGYMRIKPEVARIVEYQSLNLANKNWHLKDTFDIIFCRNVVIYFDQDLQRKVFDHFAELLNPDGILIIGYSEILYKISDRFQNIGRNIYRKTS